MRHDTGVPQISGHAALDLALEAPRLAACTREPLAGSVAYLPLGGESALEAVLERAQLRHGLGQGRKARQLLAALGQEASHAACGPRALEHVDQVPRLGCPTEDEATSLRAQGADAAKRDRLTGVHERAGLGRLSQELADRDGVGHEAFLAAGRRAALGSGVRRQMLQQPGPLEALPRVQLALEAHRGG